MAGLNYDSLKEERARIKTEPFPIKEKELIDRYMKVSTPMVNDVLREMELTFQTFPNNLMPLRENMKMAGCAFTIKGSKNLTLNEEMIDRAKMLESIPEDSVCVWDTSEDNESAQWGEIMTMASIRQGCRGAVVDGGVRDTDRVLQLPNKDETFKLVLENILKALDPSIQRVDISNEVDSTYVIRINNRSVIIQDGEKFETEQLSSGTKAGVEIALVVSALMQNKYSFYYCDEKFSYIHSDIEKAVLSLMVDYVRPNGQLFFTSHNTDILDVNLPKHSFTFLRKDVSNIECPITCIDAAALLKRNTDSRKSAVDNDMFSSAPAVDTIYAIAEI
jgi:hypothetical protein